MLYRLLTVALVILSASGCAGGGPSSEVLAQSLDAHLAEGSSMPFAVNDEERACTASAAVEIYGVDQLSEAGVTASGATKFNAATLEPSDGMGQAMAKCVDLVARFSHELGGGDKGVEACVAGVVTEKQVLSFIGASGDKALESALEELMSCFA